MTYDVTTHVTLLLDAAGQGDRAAADLLLERVYGELRGLAAGCMAGEPVQSTMQATALVHEAWLRLGGKELQSFECRSHFFGAAAEAMRRILVEHARKRRALKRGGDQERVTLQDLGIAAAEPQADVLAVDEALAKLAVAMPRVAEIVKLRFFLGLGVAETAQALGCSTPTIKREWAFGRAWLRERIDRVSASK